MKQLLQQIIQIPELHGRFLNTLSFLEYIGARKILKSQHQATFTSELLSHAAEEIRHAQVLKRVALKYASALCDSYAPSALLAGEAAKTYFQTVDHAAQQEFGEANPWLLYLYTTYLVEERANWLYPLYDEVVAKAGLPSVFRGILVEEERHLREIIQALDSDKNASLRLVKLKLLEEQAFINFTAELSQEIQANIAASSGALLPNIAVA